MDGKEAIIKRIRADAEKKAKGLIDNAEKTADDRKAEAEAWAEEYVAAQEKILKRDAEDIVSRRLTVADLDVRKLILEAKQNTINEVLESVYGKLCSLSKTEYIKFVEKLITDAADEGDEIVLSCDKVISSEDIKKTDVFVSKKLTVSKTLGEFVGGVYLVGKNCDKDLTFKAVVDSGRDIFVSEISEELFGK